MAKNKEQKINKIAFEGFNFRVPILVLIKNYDIIYNIEKSYYLRAEMVNRSQSRMYFESDYAFQPKSNINIRMVNNNATDDSITDIGDGYYAEVIWCRKISDSVIRYRTCVTYSKSLISQAADFKNQFSHRQKSTDKTIGHYNEV